MLDMIFRLGALAAAVDILIVALVLYRNAGEGALPAAKAHG